MDFLSDPGVILCVLILVTLVAIMESFWARWSPYFFFSASFCLLVPWLAAKPSIAPAASESSVVGPTPLLVGLAFLAMIAWEHGICTWLYEHRFLRSMGLRGHWKYDSTAALDLLASSAAKRHRLNPATSQAIFLGFTIAWAPFGESLFYWSYAASGFADTLDNMAALSLAVIFMAARHGSHFLFFWPTIPWVAGAVFTITALGSGFILGGFYLITRSLWGTVGIHLAANLVWVVLGFRMHRKSRPGYEPEK